MEAKIENNKLVITLPISAHSSKSGKTTVIATSGGNKPTTATYNDKPIIVGVNAYIPK